MDLNRLKIPEKQDTSRPSLWKTVILCIVCVAIGFFLSRMIDHFKSNKMRVRTITVRSASGTGAKRFTAGGWIEVSKPAYPIIVSARISEQMEKLFVKEGQTVKPGEILAKLNDKDLNSLLKVMEAKHEAADKNLEKMKAGFRKEDIDAAAAKVREAAEKLRIARANYERSKNLKPGTIASETLDKELSILKEAEARHAQLKSELEKLKTGFRTEDIAVAKADLSKAQAQMELAKRNVSYCTLKTPDVGKPLRVLAIHHSVGEWINTGKSPAVISLYDPAEVQVRVDVNQSNIKSIKINDPVRVTTSASADKEYKGRVLRIEPLAELAKNTITVRVSIDEPDDKLFPEMVAQISFMGSDTKTDIQTPLRVPAEAVIQEGNDYYVFILEDKRARRKQVTVIKEEANQAVIGKGLNSGQRVIVSDPNVLKDGQYVEDE
ncbi:efflux RND transporter periplasmic adaptor subunit [Planctomycetota bacterium]